MTHQSVFQVTAHPRSPYARGVKGPTLAVIVALAAACAGDDDADDGTTPPPDPQTFHFGPFDMQPGEERFGDCVSASLDNDEILYVNAVELSTQSGFHHSNWFWVPETTFPGPDGVWDCDERFYDEVTAGAAGGVLFAQSTQSVNELQQFPPGVVIPIPRRSKIVAGIHILNASDEPLSTTLDIEIRPIALPDVRTKLVAMALTYEPLALPAMRRSSFTVECPLGDLHQQIMGRPLDFKLYYALPHYHDLGRGVELVATGGPNGDATILSSDTQIGDALGRAFEPAFSMEGFSGIRFTCKFDNPRAEIVRWGLGDQEMCVIQTFTDSTYKWAGGARDTNPGDRVDDGNVVAFTHPNCELYGFPAPEI
jgi:hypothetical protein